MPEDEDTRLVALHEYQILETAPEDAYDDIVRLAAFVCATPIAAITLIDTKRQRFKSTFGFSAVEIPRESAFCAHTILHPDLMVIPDAMEDSRFAGNPYVNGDPYIRFYAGASLVTGGGHALGALCVIDRQPRQLTAEQETALRTLARQVTNQLELHRRMVLQEQLVDELKAMKTVQEALQAQQGVFLRDVLSSVTEGKLLLMSNHTQLPALRTPRGKPIPLTLKSGLRELRMRAQEAARQRGHSEERQQDLLTAVSEAGMNAIVHAGGGTGLVSASAEGIVQVRIEDQGTGIAMENLPRAALEKGYSSAGTLGQGMKMMLQTVDQVFLLTGVSGTIVVLEQDCFPPLAKWMRIAAA